MDSLSPEAAVEFLRDHAPLAVLVLDVQGIILDANRKANEVFGDSLAGRSCRELFHAGSENEPFPNWLPTEGRTLRLDILPASGPPQPWKWSFLRRQARIYAFGLQDTEEVEGLELELLSLNAELGNLTRELHQSNAELTRVNSLKDHYLGVAAHDLRTPLGVIQAYTELLRDEAAESLGQEHREFIGIIHRNVQFMHNLINQLLDVAKIEAGLLTLNRIRLDLPELLRTNLRMNEALAAPYGITLELAVPPDFPMVQLDPARMEQAMNNLIGNAVKFSPPGSAVSVSLTLESDSFSIVVSDRGHGIDPEKQKRLLAPPETGDPKSGPKARGGGLGLLIVRSIAEAHGGSIEVESQPGQGSKFLLKFRLDRLTS